MTAFATRPAPPRPLDPTRFRDPQATLDGKRRARVAFTGLRTLWINTGTLCNITCANCYIESSPRNDSLAYISAAEVAASLDEAAAAGQRPETVGFTGGEPFLNRDLPAMLRDALGRGCRALVLTNAMKPMRRHEGALRALGQEFGDRLTLRVSLDHPDAARHDLERGGGSFAQALAGLEWLARNGLRVQVAGRAGFGADGEAAIRRGFAALFAAHGLPVDAGDPVELVLFPEMDAAADVPEISEACWGILGKSPGDMMCASARMIVRRRGADRSTVVACTLIPHDARFDLGPTLADALRPVALNHPHCAKFCVLGGAACSR
jgi:uncharacterized Fe-S cluster-containing radical SAM superfamily protein